MKGIENQDEHWKVLVFLLNQSRKDKGLTVQDVADRVGIAQSHLSRFLSAKHKPSLQLFLSVAKAVGLEVEVKKRKHEDI